MEENVNQLSSAGDLETMEVELGTEPKLVLGHFVVI